MFIYIYTPSSRLEVCRAKYVAVFKLGIFHFVACVPLLCIIIFQVLAVHVAKCMCMSNLSIVLEKVADKLTVK